jgi:hypothetical protein
MPAQINRQDYADGFDANLAREAIENWRMPEYSSVEFWCRQQRRSRRVRCTFAARWASTRGRRCRRGKGAYAVGLQGDFIETGVALGLLLP